MPKFKNKGDEVHLYKPAGHPDALRVEAGQTVDVQGEVSSETADAYIVGEGDNALAFPKALWELAQASQPARDRGAKTDTKE